MNHHARPIRSSRGRHEKLTRRKQVRNGVNVDWGRRELPSQMKLFLGGRTTVRRGKTKMSRIKGRGRKEGGAALSGVSTMCS